LVERVLVTGSNKGIGLGVCAAFADRGADVLATCRTGGPELAALGVRVIEGIDVADDGVVGRLRAAIGPDPLDVLVANAGINVDAPGLDDLDLQALERTFQVNALGAVRTVMAALPSLRAGSKIMLVGSSDPLNRRHPVGAGNYGYWMAKAALASFGHGLARDVRERGIAVIISAPGPTDTPMLRNVHAEGRTPLLPGDAADPYEIGRLFRDRIDELTLDASPAWQAGPRGEPAAP